MLYVERQFCLPPPLSTRWKLHSQAAMIQGLTLTSLLHLVSMVQVFSAAFEGSERLAKAVSIVKRATAHLSQEAYFKGEFGCAVVALSDDLAQGPFHSAAVDECHLLLVCLDKWEFGVKR